MSFLELFLRNNSQGESTSKQHWWPQLTPSCWSWNGWWNAILFCGGFWVWFFWCCSNPNLNPSISEFSMKGSNTIGGVGLVGSPGAMGLHLWRKRHGVLFWSCKACGYRPMEAGWAWRCNLTLRKTDRTSGTRMKQKLQTPKSLLLLEQPQCCRANLHGQKARLSAWVTRRVQFPWGSKVSAWTLGKLLNVLDLCPSFLHNFLFLSRNMWNIADMEMRHLKFYCLA